jgi:hypothetical protein
MAKAPAKSPKKPSNTDKTRSKPGPKPRPKPAPKPPAPTPVNDPNKPGGTPWPVYRPMVATVAQEWLLEGRQIAGFAPAAAKAQLKDLTLQVGDQPIVRSIRRLCQKRGVPLPPEIDALPGETYIITHVVGVLAQTGANTVGTLGYTAEFDGKGSTIELLPNTRFKEYISGSLSAGLDFSAGLSAEGYAELPKEVGQLAGLPPVDLGGGAKLELSTAAKVVGKVSFSLKTPKVQAIGTGGSAAAWQFDKDENPLVGDQVMLQTVVVPRGQKRLAFTLQAYMVVPRWWGLRRPVRCETKPLKVVVDLTDPTDPT